MIIVNELWQYSEQYNNKTSVAVAVMLPNLTMMIDISTGIQIQVVYDN